MNYSAKYLFHKLFYGYMCLRWNTFEYVFGVCLHINYICIILWQSCATSNFDKRYPGIIIMFYKGPPSKVSPLYEGGHISYSASKFTKEFSWKTKLLLAILCV